MRVLLILVLVCFLLGCVRFGGTVLYDADGLTIWVRVLCFRIRVYPPKRLTASEQAAAEEKKRRKAQEARLKAQAQAEKAEAKRLKARNARIDREQRRLDFLVRCKRMTRAEADAKMEAFLAALDAPPPKPKKQGGKQKLLLDLIPVGLKALGEFKNILRFDELTVEYTIPGKYDPYGAAMQYGAIAAGSGPVARAMDKQVKVKRRRVSAFVDFCASEALVWAKLTVTLSLGAVLLLGIRAAYRALRVFLRYRKAQKEKAAAKAAAEEQAAPAAAPQTDQQQKQQA